MTEILNNRTENLLVKPEVVPDKVDTQQLAAETIAADFELQKAQAGDQQISTEKYNKVLAEVKGIQNPAEVLKQIDTQLKELTQEKDTRSEDYRSLVTQKLGSSPMAGLNFGSGKIEALAKKYPGVDKVAEALAIAHEQNKLQPVDKNANFLGKMFGKKTQELGNNAHVLVENFLTTGSIGIINGVNNPLKEYKPVIEFLAKNSPELLKSNRVQEIIKKLYDSDAEFAKENSNLLVAKEEITNQPASAKEAIGSSELIKKIKELEAEKKRGMTAYYLNEVERLKKEGKIS